jgi:hypothetical protein
MSALTSFVSASGRASLAGVNHMVVKRGKAFNYKCIAAECGGPDRIGKALGRSSPTIIDAKDHPCSGSPPLCLRHCIGAMPVHLRKAVVKGAWAE